MQLYANIRPIRCFTKPRLADAEANDIDWMFIRENSEGEYSGHGGRSHVGEAWEVATDTSIFTRHGVRRIMEFAFDIASKRPKRHLTVVTKSNALRHGLVLWDEVAAEVACEFPQVSYDMMLVDAMTVRMVQRPTSIDAVVGTNLHIDILSDLAAALAGSIGIASSGNLDPTRSCPSIFEPVHGSAFDITSRGIANPIGAIWASAEMLSWLGEEAAADAIIKAIRTACKRGQLTRDMGGVRTTDEVTKFICDVLSSV